MPDLWMPGATRLDVGDHAPTDGGPAKAIAHITWDDNGTAAKPIPLEPYENLVGYFGRNDAGRKAAPHILWDPFTGRFTQFVPADSRSKSLADSAGGTRTNRAGSVVIQIETLFFPYCQWNGKTYARLVDTPCKGWPELLAWVRSWGVPDVWPMGRPVNFNANRSEAIWASKGGWYAHAHVPENDHQDPGSWPGFTTSEEDDMALTDDDLKRIALAVLGYKGKTDTGATDPLDVYAYIRGTDSKANSLKAQITGVATGVGEVRTDVRGLSTAGLTDAQIATIAEKVAASDALAEKVAERVAGKLADRLAE
ncbi:endolysin [Streptomyces goshikiensis]|uniref:endolysin n=1 Tax=Streptomyces goshikiensis TaxID=1942 RepID=UPI002E127437|nr:endolysin [Streptomyces goshikiensis]